MSLTTVKHKPIVVTTGLVGCAGESRYDVNCLASRLYPEREKIEDDFPGSLSRVSFYQTEKGGFPKKKESPACRTLFPLVIIFLLENSLHF